MHKSNISAYKCNKHKTVSFPMTWPGKNTVCQYPVTFSPCRSSDRLNPASMEIVPQSCSVWQCSFYSSAMFCLFVFGMTAPQQARASSFTGFLDHTRWRTTVSRTPLDELSARCRDLYLTPNVHVPSGIWIHNLGRRAAEDPRLRPHGHWDRPTAT
jgi:hypothetical protein